MQNHNEFVLKKALIERLDAKDLLHSEYLDIQQWIFSRVGEIWKFILSVSNRGHKTCIWDFQGGPNFNFNRFKEEIKLIHEEPWHKNSDYIYNNGFPTRFLWEVSYTNEVMHHLHTLEHPESEKDTIAFNLFELMLKQVSALHYETDDLEVSNRDADRIVINFIENYCLQFEEITGICPIFNGNKAYIDQYYNICYWRLFPVVE